MITDLIPESLQHNPNWVYFYKACDFMWNQHVLSNIEGITVPMDFDSDGATREDILLRASRFGWMFTDNFSANWENDERAERFLKRFITSWIQYCRNSAGTDSLAPYMGYLLGMEIRIVQLWSNDKSAWDSKPLKRLIRMDSTELPKDYMVTQLSEEPFYDPTYQEEYGLRSVSELNNKMQGWKTIDVDPENGWYPTSHFDVYVDLDQVPKSDVPEKTAEEIIAGLFYELADICQVLRAVVYSYGFTQIVKIASGASIVNRMGNYNIPDLPELAWGSWSISGLPTVTGTTARYNSSKTNGVMTYDSFATLNLNAGMLKSLADSSMQQWQGVKDAIAQLSGASSWTFNNTAKTVAYTTPLTVPNNCGDGSLCSTVEWMYLHEGNYYSNPQAFCDAWFVGTVGWGSPLPEIRAIGDYCKLYGGGNGYDGNVATGIEPIVNPKYNPASTAPYQYLYKTQNPSHQIYVPTNISGEALCKDYIRYFDINDPTENLTFKSYTEGTTPTCSMSRYKTSNGSYINDNGLNILRETNPNYNPNATVPTSTLTYQQVVDKIVSNMSVSDQGTSLLAQTYVEVVAKSYDDPVDAKQFVKISDFESQFDTNKTLRT